MHSDNVSDQLQYVHHELAQAEQASPLRSIASCRGCCSFDCPGVVVCAILTEPDAPMAVVRLLSFWRRDASAGATPPEALVFAGFVELPGFPTAVAVETAPELVTATGARATPAAAAIGWRACMRVMRAARSTPPPMISCAMSAFAICIERQKAGLIDHCSALSAARFIMKGKVALPR